MRDRELHGQPGPWAPGWVENGSSGAARAGFELLQVQRGWSGVTNPPSRPQQHHSKMPQARPHVNWQHVLPWSRCCSTVTPELDVPGIGAPGAGVLGCRLGAVAPLGSGCCFSPHPLPPWHRQRPHPGTAAAVRLSGQQLQREFVMTPAKGNSWSTTNRCRYTSQKE